MTMHECTNAPMRVGPGRRSPRRLPAAFCAFVLLCICAFLASSCAHIQARGPSDAPRLDVPPPPPRVVEPEPEPPAPAPAPEEQPAPPAQQKPPVRHEPPKPEMSKPEPPKPEPPAEAKPEESRPPATLQTAPTQGEAELERTIRATLGQAKADLARVDVRTLNADARTQYDTAQRFVAQADEAVRARNLVFAKSLADKAAALAAQLAGK